MTHLRTCFEVKGNIRFLSHLDLLKVMERSLRRAQIPVAFSQGFNPHPKIAFGPARAVGLSSECEYFDVELNAFLSPAQFRERLQEKCPAGIFIKDAGEIAVGAAPLMAVLNCAAYRVKIDCPSGLTQEELNRQIKYLLDKKEIIVERVSPKGRKVYDIRPGIWDLSACLDQEEIFVFMDVMIGNEGNVRPGEVISALKLPGCEVVDIIRTGLYIRKKNGEKEKPM